MSDFTLSILTGCLFLLGTVVRKAYLSLPLHELRRRARKSSPEHKALYKVRAYGASLETLLWLWLGLAGAFFFYEITREINGVTAVVIMAGLIWLGFFWLPSSRVTRLGVKLAVWLAPVLARVLSFAHPVLNSIGEFLSSLQKVTIHTGLYEKDDLVKLLKQQQNQPDSRISKDELEIAANALKFGDELVRNVLISKRVVRFVSVDETVGPILMGELHESGHSRFPVYEGKKDKVVGTLMLRDMVGKKSGGKVSSIMRPEVMYLHESQNLLEALQAMLKTRHHLFIVVNDFEEIAGIITLEDVIERIIGKQIIDEFDKYDDLRAVAQREAAEIHNAENHPEIVPDEPQG